MQLPCHVAVVEDHAGLLADLVEFLELRGFSVRGFDSAESFFSVWPATHFDLLLLDVALPGVSGLEIAQRVRSNDAHNTTGVVMLTALDANDDQVLGFHAGADVYLSKRSSLDVIEAACHGVLRRLGRREANHPTSKTSPAVSSIAHKNNTKPWGKPKLMAANRRPAGCARTNIAVISPRTGGSPCRAANSARSAVAPQTPT